MKKTGLIAASLTALALAQGPSSSLAQESTSTRSAAYQSSVAQDQLRAQTKRLKEDMLRMLEEFRQNPAAAAEVAQAQAALEKLGSLSDKEMLAVVQSLREASRVEAVDEAKTKMVAASNDQKQIQSALQALSDRMTLFRDEASIQQRLNSLVLRQLAAQRQSRNLTDGTVRDWEVKTVFPITVSEQEALKTEINLLLETLKKLAANPASTARQTFANVLAAGQNLKIETLVASAVTDLSAKNYPGAIDNQGKVVAGLQNLIDVLNKAKTDEERMQAAATKVKELAALQKQLANNAVKAPVYAMGNILGKQQQITDQVTAIQKEINEISPQSANPLEEARKTMENVDKTIKSAEFKKNEGNKTPMIESQKGAADKLEMVADMLQKKADEMAGADSSAGTGGESPDSKAMQAINDAAKEVLKAQSNISLANSLMNNPGAVDAAKSQMDGAQSALDKAQQALQGAGEAVAPSVGENLSGADKDVAGTKAQTGTGADQEKARWGLDRAGEKAAAALKGLQDAANALAAKGGANEPGKGQPGKGQPGKSGKFDGTVAGGAGAPGNTAQEDSDFSAISKLSDKERMALSVLQREKSPPEYSVMVQQYLKNLADGDMPGQ